MSLRCLTIACFIVLLAGRCGWAQELPNPMADPVADPAIQPPVVPDQEKFGVAPEDYSHEFLRQESVLLKPGQWQMDVGLNYAIVEHYYTLIDNSGAEPEPVDTLLRRRLLVMPLQIRYGLAERIQLFADMPVGWTNTEISTLGADMFTNHGGLGDASAGFTYMVYKGDGWCCIPDVVASFGFTAPTSDSDLYAALFGTPQTTLGQGVWAGFWSVLFMHSYDPITVFYGFGSRHAFTKSISGHDVLPGDQYLYRGGVGFAVNERITLSGMLYGYYITEARVDGIRVNGTIQEPVYLRFAATMMRRCNRICEPFAEIGLTDDAANARFGVTWTF